MRLITTRTLIREVAERWGKQYQNSLAESKFGIVRRELSALDPEIATEADVCLVIGNSAWTQIRCDECREEVNAVVELGEEPDYESSTAKICTRCLGAASALLAGDR